LPTCPELSSTPKQSKGLHALYVHMCYLTVVSPSEEHFDGVHDHSRASFTKYIAGMTRSVSLHDVAVVLDMHLSILGKRAYKARVLLISNWGVEITPF